MKDKSPTNMMPPVFSEGAPKERVRDKKGFTLVEIIASVVVIGIIIYAVFSIFITSGFRSVNIEIYTVAQTLAEGKLEEMMARDFTTRVTTGETSFPAGDLGNYSYEVVGKYVTPEALDAPVADEMDDPPYSYKKIQVMIRHPKLIHPVTLESIRADYEG
jgi:prepilin-type N-terminal cleavage/methylation domain-containing protein